MGHVLFLGKCNYFTNSRSHFEEISFIFAQKPNCLEAIERFTVSKDWMSLCFLLAFSLMALAKYLFPERFDNFTKLLTSNRHFNAKLKKMTLAEPFSFLLDFIHLLSISILLFLVFQHFSFFAEDAPFLNFVRVGLGYALFFTVLYIVEKIVADLLQIESIIENYIFYKVTWRNFISFVLLPIEAIFIYAFPPSDLSLYILLILIALINTGLLLSYYLKNQKLLSAHWFYFILYLCTFEIAPYFILYKAITIA